MKAIVTGGAGFIGSHLTDRLIDEGYEVVVLDNLSSGKKENINPKAVMLESDICDLEKIKPHFKGADFVFHLAANPSVPVSVNDPIGTSRTNILGAINVFKASLSAKVKRVIFISSAAVYGDKRGLLSEDDDLNPITPYAVQKLSGEYFAKLFSCLYGLPIVSLRFFNIYGPRSVFDSDYSLVINKFIGLKIQKKPLTIFGTGKQVRGFCYVSDAINATILAVKSKKLKGGEVINIGSEKSYSINYIAKKIGGSVKYLQKRSGDIFSSRADIKLAKNILGWKPEICLRDGIKRVEEWILKNVDFSKN